jgi:acetyltransferase-like isoleucine patch superfamily enzyme
VCLRTLLIGDNAVCAKHVVFMMVNDTKVGTLCEKAPDNEFKTNRKRVVFKYTAWLGM